MVLEVTVFPKLLKKSKMEAVSLRLIKLSLIYKKLKFNLIFKMGWLITYLGVMILDVDVGLYIGVAVSLLLVIFRSQR